MITGLHHGTPIFGEVQQVLVVDGHIVVLKYQNLRVIEFVSHLNAVRVVTDNEVGYMKQSNLQDFHPVAISKGFGHYSNKYFIVLRYRVDCLQ